MRSTSNRLEMWSDSASSGTSGTIPEGVDDPLQAVCADGVGHVVSGLAVGLDEVDAAHAAHEVVDRVHTVVRGVDGLRVEDVHRHRLDLVAPPALRGVVGLRDRRPDGMTGLQKRRHEPAPDVPRRAGDQNLQDTLRSAPVSGGLR